MLSKLEGVSLATLSLSLRSAVPRKYICVLDCFTDVLFGAGISANFSSFGDAFHLIFQLMFGEDMPTLWDDCALKPPYCTPDFTDVHGKVNIGPNHE
jgi:hypothetical protein